MISEQRHLGYFARWLHVRSNWNSLRVPGVKKPDLDFALAVDLVELRLIALLTFFSV